MYQLSLVKGSPLIFIFSISPLYLPKKNGVGPHGSQQQGQWYPSEQDPQSRQLCFLTLSTLAESIPWQSCCHLWSFGSRQVIYRNLFVQSQYLPVGSVKFCNPSLPLSAPPLPLPRWLLFISNSGIFLEENTSDVYWRWVAHPHFFFLKKNVVLSYKNDSLP